MSLVTRCPYCRARHTVAEEEGASFRCPRCRNFFLVETDQEASATASLKSQVRQEPKVPTRPMPAPSMSEAPAETLDTLERPPAQETASSSPAASAASAASAPRSPFRFHPLAMASLFLAALALIIAPWPGVRYLTIPCALLGLAGAILLVRHFQGLSIKDRTWSIVAGIANLLVLAVALIWPHWLGMIWLGTVPMPGEDSPQALRVSMAGERGQPLAEGEWADASQEAVRQRGVQVRVLGVTQGKTKIGPGKDKITKQGWLQIRLSVRNLSIDRRLVYQSWSQASGEPAAAAQLRADTSLPLRPWESELFLEGQTAQANLAPGQGLEDLLFFDPPPAEATSLFLELPASAWGGEGTLRFAIPRTMIRHDPQPLRIMAKKKQPQT